MSKESRYKQLMNKYDIVSIKGGSDLALDSSTGSLMMSKRGDFMWQGKAHNAMFQFVRDYEMNEPKLRAQFNDILESHVKEDALVEASNKHAEDIAARMKRNEPVDGEEMHALSNQRGATQTGRELAASSIFVAMNNMLQVLKDELGVDQNKFNASSPIYNGQSFGNVIWAASNNARHADEWRVQWVANKAFTKQQLNSVQVLAPVLGHEEKDYRFLAGEICAEVLSTISIGDFDILERALFTYANNLAAGVENNKSV